MSNSGKGAHVLFICKGNLCRSPMAMAILRHLRASRGSEYEAVVESAGYYDWGTFTREAHPFARQAVEHFCGADLLSNHIARRWDESMVQRADLVVVAEEWMCADFPSGGTVTMMQLAGGSGDVSDPYGSDLPAYLECARLIERLLIAGLPRLEGLSGARGIV
ncbi:MAG: hypothetical protein JXA58_03825 [Dehalococcoidia bacterium]|nr:hypothetical protein [Dehalococcoidia bacterium]